MKIIGSKLRSGLYSVDAILSCPSLNIEEYVNFVVDTGAVSTIINDIDVIILGIDYDKLNPVEKEKRVFGIEARIEKKGEKPILDTFTLPLSKVKFRDADSGKTVSETLETGLVLRHNEMIDKIKGSEELRIWIKDLIPSLLGIDILRNYNIRFTDLGVYLEI